MIRITKEDKERLKELVPRLKHNGYADGDFGYYFREFTYDEWFLIIKACNKCLE